MLKGILLIFMSMLVADCWLPPLYRQVMAGKLRAPLGCSVKTELGASFFLGGRVQALLPGTK